MSLVDFTAAPRRKESVRFDLLDEDFNCIGTVHPLGTPSLRVERSRQVKRSLSGFTLLPPESQTVTPTTPVRPSWVFEDGTEYQLGVFYLADELVRPDADEPLDSGTLGDGMVLYRESLGQTFSVRTGDPIMDKLIEASQLSSRAAPRVVRDTRITAMARSPMAWVAGTPIVTVIEDLADAGGIRVYFDVTGALRFELTDTDPDVLDLTEHQAGTLKFRYNSEDAPNRWVARDNSQGFSVIGIYDLPDAAPHSFAKRGRYVTRIVEISGLTDQDAADAAAREAALDEEFPYKAATAEFCARPDLDVFCHVRLSNGQVYILDSFDTELGASGSTSIDCQAVWDNPATPAYELRSSIDQAPVIPGDVPPLRAYMLWNPKFLRYWRTLDRRERAKLRRFFDAQAQADRERRERRRRRHERPARRPRRPSQWSTTGTGPALHGMLRHGTVVTSDPQLGVATVRLDGDDQGSEIQVQMESEAPSIGQPVTVRFNSPTPTLVGQPGGQQRLMGRARVVSLQTEAGSAEVDLTNLEVEAAVTAPGRAIKITMRGQVLATVANSGSVGVIYRDDGAGGAYTEIGRWMRDESTPAGSGRLYQGFAMDYSPDPGVYSYKAALQVAGGFTLRSGVTPSDLLVEDVGADPEATSA